MARAAAQAPGSGAQPPAPRLATAFRATHYEVTAALMPAEHRLTARAKVDFRASATSRTLEVELHPSLKLNSVYGADRRALPFEREGDTPVVRVALAQPVNAGEATSLTFDYSGPLAEAEDMLPGGVRLAYIGREGSYLLQPARWFPLTDYPANRYTAVFQIAAPENVPVVGPGDYTSPTTVGATAEPTPLPAAEVEPAKRPPSKRSPAKSAAAPAAPAAPQAPLVTPGPIAPAGYAQYTFRNDRPEASGSFVAAGLQLTPVNAQGQSVLVYAAPAQVATSKAYGEAAAKILEFFSGEFAPLPNTKLALAQFPPIPGAPHGYSAPGLLLMNPRQWGAEVNSRLLSQLVARQWWGNEILPATANDVWLSDGLARYSEVTYARTESEGQANQALEDFAVNALMYEDAAPISQAARLVPFSAEYRSVVMNKGAMVFHMLRSQLGEERFRALLREYLAKFSGKAARIEDFQALAREKAAGATRAASTAPVAAADSAEGSAPNLAAFFAQWLHSTGVPEFKLEFVVYRTQKGFKIVGKVRQDLETFRQTINVRVDTEGNPEMRQIDVIGSNSDFTIETFGRPRPGGILLDPDNHLLKSSPRLRVRASIARGEAHAEEGKYFEAIQQYQTALETQPNNSLAHFRMAEAFFYQKNRQAAANAFRDAIDGDRDPKWTEVWSHIYLGKIFDVTGQRERAVNEYTKAQETNDDTGGAQAEAAKYLKTPYTEPN